MNIAEEMKAIAMAQHRAIIAAARELDRTSPHANALRRALASMEMIREKLLRLGPAKHDEGPLLEAEQMLDDAIAAAREALK